MQYSGLDSRSQPFHTAEMGLQANIIVIMKTTMYTAVIPIKACITLWTLLS